MKHQAEKLFENREPIMIGGHSARIVGPATRPAMVSAPRTHSVIPMVLPTRTGGYRLLGKRLFDIAFVLLTAPITLPLIMIAALALAIEGGQPFYTQKRRGLGGRGFSILKLRTMVRDADARMAALLASDPALREEWETTQKLRHDPRITRVGAFLRRTSLDELPQFFNVLRGDMSVVGPRPMMPEQRVLYGDTRHYDALRPGVTGLWQVSRRNESLFTERLDLDAQYDAGLSFGEDLALILKTIGVVLRRTGY